MNIKHLLLSLLFSSCGYEIPEEDKYPELPTLSEVSHPNFEIIKFPYYHYDYLGFVNGQLYTTASITSEEYGWKEYVIIFDKELNIKNKIPTKRDIDVLQNGDFYLQDYMYYPDEDEVIKYTYPDFKSTVIKKYPLTYDSIYDKYRTEIFAMKKKDDTFNSTEYLTNIIHEKLTLISKEKLLCHMKLKNIRILKIDDEEFWVDDNIDLQPFPLCDEPMLNADKIDHQQLTIFDKAVLGNNSSGNHFSFWYYPFGIQYATLSKGQDSLNFKYYSDNINGESLKEYEGFHPDQIIIRTDGDRNMYLIK